MKVLLALLLMMSPAFAAPPVVGTEAEFSDPVLGTVIICDTDEQIKLIASADDPVAAYKSFRVALNDRGEPVCIAARFTAEVVSVEAIGVVHAFGSAFHAWSVGVTNAGVLGFALYLELFNEVAA